MIDLFAGLGGWAEGGIAEGYRVVGFDIERHEYGDHKHPAQLVIQDVLTLDGRQFKDAALIVASPPCQEFSYMAMPWTLAKEKQARILADAEEQKRLTALFDACFRIQREACEAAGRHIPLVVENVRGAQKWVGRAGWHFGSFYLWGDIPALMPITSRLTSPKVPRVNGKANNYEKPDYDRRPLNGRPSEVLGVKVSMPPGGDSLTVGFQQVAKLQAAEGFKSAGMNWSDQTKRGQDFTRVAGSQSRATHEHIKVSSTDGGRRTDPGGDWFNSNEPSEQRKHGSKSNARKAASAVIAKIPFVLAQHIARSWKPG